MQCAVVWLKPWSARFVFLQGWHTSAVAHRCGRTAPTVYTHEVHIQDKALLSVMPVVAGCFPVARDARHRAPHPTNDLG